MLQNPAKLKLEQFEEETIRPSISLPADFSPDGNCKRDGSNRPRPSTTGRAEPSTSGLSTAKVILCVHMQWQCSIVEVQMSASEKCHAA